MVDHTFWNSSCRFHRIWLSKQNTRTGQILARIRDMLKSYTSLAFVTSSECTNHQVKAWERERSKFKMSAEEDTELRDMVAQTLESKGVLGKIRVRNYAFLF